MALQSTLQETADAIELLNYTDGDVWVLLSPCHQYHLHSIILKLSSGYFRSLLEERGPDESHQVQLVFSPPDNEAYSINPTHCGGFRLQMTSGDEVIHSGDVHQVKTSALSAPTNENIYKSYERVFLSFYGHSLELSEAPTYKPSILEVENILALAEGLGALGTVGIVVDMNLWALGQRLWESIADNPAGWGDFGVRIRSSVIVSEAVCHLVGIWNRSGISTGVAIFNDHGFTQLVRRKWEELEALRAAAERRILDYYPSTLEPAHESETAETEASKSQGSTNKLTDRSKNTIDWMALSLFRQWIGQRFCSGDNRKAEDGGYALYSIINKAEDSYIDSESYKAFLSTFPLSPEATTNFDAALKKIKEETKDYVKELVESKCSLDVNEYPVTWLTCTEVKEEEMPWIQHTALEPPQTSSTGAQFMFPNYPSLSSNSAPEPTNFPFADQQDMGDPASVSGPEMHLLPQSTMTGSNNAPANMPTWAPDDQITLEPEQAPVSNHPTDLDQIGEDPMSTFLENELGQNLADDLLELDDNVHMENTEPN